MYLLCDKNVNFIVTGTAPRLSMDSPRSRDLIKIICVNHDAWHYILGMIWESFRDMNVWMLHKTLQVNRCYSHFTNKRRFYLPMRHCHADRWIWECAGRCEPSVSIQSLMSPSSSATQQSISINNQKFLPLRETLVATCDAFLLPQLFKVCGCCFWPGTLLGCSL